MDLVEQRLQVTQTNFSTNLEQSQMLNEHILNHSSLAYNKSHDSDGTYFTNLMVEEPNTGVRHSRWVLLIKLNKNFND